MKTNRPSALTRGRITPQGPSGGDVERGKGRRTSYPSRVKVVDRDTVLELLSQLRDFLESCAEEVNDRVVTVPSEQPELPYEDAPWPSDDE